MAYDRDLADRVRRILGDRRGVTERRMFGGLAFLIRGHMVAGLRGGTLMARVGPDRHAEALARPHARPMDFTGRPMKGYVYVDPEGIETAPQLEWWIGTCADFVAGLPPKPPK